MGSLICTGIARITRDAEVRKTGSGSWLSFGVAAFRKNSKEGKQDVDFFDVDLYCKDYVNGAEKKFNKGTLLYIENSYLRNDQFKGTDGKEKSKVKLLINAYEILNKPAEFKKETKPEATHPTDLPPPIEKPFIRITLNPAEDEAKRLEKTSAAVGVPEFKPETEEEYQDKVPF